MKLKPLEHPTFYGKAKSYSRFKQRFEEMINPNFDEMAQLEFLERTIPKAVRDKMSMVRKTTTQIW